jgi:hypothetical protein
MVLRPRALLPPLTLLDVVVSKRASVLELLAGEDEALLVRGDAWRGGAHMGDA